MLTSSFGAPNILSAPISGEVELPTTDPITRAQVERYVDIYFADIPVMKDVAWCESRFRHFGEDGRIIRGDINRSDLGVMQINEYYHADTAERLGIDLYSFAGNLQYARYLYEKEGTQPWSSSMPCWGEENHVAMR